MTRAIIFLCFTALLLTSCGSSKDGTTATDDDSAPIEVSKDDISLIVGREGGIVDQKIFYQVLRSGKINKVNENYDLVKDLKSIPEERVQDWFDDLEEFREAGQLSQEGMVEVGADFSNHLTYRKGNQEYKLTWAMKVQLKNPDIDRLFKRVMQVCNGQEGRFMAE